MNELTTHPIVLFDGVCNLCNRVVQFIIKNDGSKKFRFTSLQSEIGQQLLKKHGLNANDFTSFVLIYQNKVYLKSSAALKIAQILGGGWQLFYGFIIVPPVIRNAIYSFIANNRYKWFGKQQSCWLPTPELQNRFL